MLRTRSWIVAGAAALAVLILIALAIRGPVSDRAPPPARDDPFAPEDPAQVGGASLGVEIVVQPAGCAPAWRLEIHDAKGRRHERSGTGAQRCRIDALHVGRALCALRAPGFVGETSRIDVEEGREATVSLNLRRFGRVGGFVRCDGAPVAGALVRLTLPQDAAAASADLAPEDRGVAMAWSVESAGDGRYQIDRVLPARGVTLVAADFDHPPGRAGPIDVEPGADANADFSLVVGTHLSGRVVDLRGSPCAGATVNVLEQRVGRNTVTWADEARARADDDGRFITPALGGTAPRMLKAWVAVDGVQQVIQHVATPPDRGTKDVGTLAPLPGVVVLETADPPQAKLTVTVVGAGDASSGIVLGGMPLDAEGRLRIAGLPPGEATYDVVDASCRAVSEGRFEVTGRDMVVRIAPLHAPGEEPPEPAETLFVDAQGHAGVLLLVGDDLIVLWMEVPAKHERIPWKVGPGKYTAYFRAGDRVGRQEVVQERGKDSALSIVPDRVGRSLALTVLDGGKPVAHATIYVRGFRAGAKGRRTPWAETGDDGRAVLKGLPPDATALDVTVLAPGGVGRSYAFDLREEVTVDLAKQTAD